MGTTEDLGRWIAAGLIDDDTARAIASFEAGRSHAGRIGRGVEALAYLGAVLVVVALGLLASEFWDRIEPWGRLVLSIVITLVLVTVGVVLGRSQEPALNRARSFAWFLVIPATALSAYVMFSDLLETSDMTTLLWVSLISLAAAVTLWWLRHSVLQMVAMGISAGALVVAVLRQFESVPDWAFGLGFAGLGVVWLFLTWGGVIGPARTGYVLGAIAVLLIAFPEGGDLPWPLLGLVAGLGLMALSVIVNEGLLLGLGVAGLFVYIPMTIFEMFGDTLGVPVALLITGLVLLGVVVVTVRLSRETRG